MSTPRIDDPDLTISEILAQWPGTIQVFLRHRMLCVGCMVSPFHTVTDACVEHGVDEGPFRAELRTAARL